MASLRGIYGFDFMGHKRWWFALSGTIILIGLVSLFTQGLNYGLEFREGTRVTVAFEQPASVAEVRQVVEDAGYGPAQVQQVTGGGGDVSYQTQVETLTPEQEADLKAKLDDRFTLASYESRTVGPTFGEEIVTRSYQAIAISLLLIVVYVSIRFQWKYAVGALAAEIHDLLIVVGIYSLTGREVTTATVAAVLTILGYSLYDTVIVYDRVRENAPKLNRLPYGQMVNRSISETLTRSLNTSFITLLPVLCLLFFGGSTLKDFAFALLVGIASGAYSTIFVANPVLCLLKEREPQYRRAAARAEES